jgi:hypothetical protein
VVADNLAPDDLVAVTLGVDGTLVEESDLLAKVEGSGLLGVDALDLDEGGLDVLTGKAALEADESARDVETRQEVSPVNEKKKEIGSKKRRSSSDSGKRKEARRAKETKQTGWGTSRAAGSAGKQKGYFHLTISNSDQNCIYH